MIPRFFTTSDLVIRSANFENFGRIAAIYNESITNGQITMDEELKNWEHVAAWVAGFSDREHLYEVVRGEEVIGWGMIKRYSDREGYRFACETSVYLTESETGKGYGKQVKEVLIEECRTFQYRHLVAKILATNEKSIAYNARLGYTTVGTQKDIGYRDGEWQDVVIMQYIIDGE